MSRRQPVPGGVWRVKARELFKSGELPEMRQLINLFLDRVVVHLEHVEVELRVVQGGPCPDLVFTC